MIGEITTIGEFEEEFDISWKSTCFPLSPEFALKLDSNKNLKYEIDHLWRSTEPEYPAGVNDLVSTSPLDVSSLFGTGGYLVQNNDDRVDLNADTFKGKFVMVCCFQAPVVDAHYILNLCEDLCSTRDDVVVVMAAWMNSLVDADDHKEVFDHFFSAFPESCLAVPFGDSKRRAIVCKLVSNYTTNTLKFFPQCLVFDTEGMVLPAIDNFLGIGVEAFPFTQEILTDIQARDCQLKESGSLEQLLRVNSFSPDVVYKFNPKGGPRKEVSISELNDKLVGLYLPTRVGNLLPTLLDIYEQCREKQLEFEIVVVYSQDRFEHLSLKVFQEMIDRLFMQKHDICRHWWCFPLDNSVSQRFNRLYPNVIIEKFCMVGPAGAYIDMHSSPKIMKSHGIDGYPFTQETIIQREVSRMKEITLESILSGHDVFRGNDRNDVVSLDKLSGKKICVYFGSLCYMWDREKVFSSYREVKAIDPKFEVVFVYLKSDSVGVDVYNKTIYAMPWYICPVDLAQLESTRERLGICGHSIVGFGEDGRLRSCREAKLATFTLDDTLYEDAMKNMKSSQEE